MNGQPSTYITVTVNDRIMYRTDDVLGGTTDEARQRGREVATMFKQQWPYDQIKVITSGQPIQGRSVR